MKKNYLFWVIFIVPLAINAANFDNVDWIKCYDGDTCTYTIKEIHPLFGKNISVRFDKIDTPEIRGECEEEKLLAKQARDFVRELHSQASKIDLINCKRGKYFRLVCDVLIDGNDLGKILIEKVHAREYDGGKRESWCD